MLSARVSSSQPSHHAGSRRDFYHAAASAVVDAAARRCWRHGVRPTTRSWGMRRYHTWAWSLVG